MDDRGPQLRLDVVADDRQARSLEARGPGGIAGDEDGDGIHHRAAGLQRAVGVELGRPLAAHGQIIDEHMSAGVTQRGDHVFAAGL